MNREFGTEISDIEREWKTDRWNGIVRPYTAEEVCRLRGSIRIDHTLAKLASEKLWNILQNEQYVHSLGAINGSQAVQMVRAGLKVIYLNGRQTDSADIPAAQVQDSLSLAQSKIEPETVAGINRALLRADQHNNAVEKGDIDWLTPVVAEGDGGPGHSLHAYELTKNMIEAGAAGLQLEDRLAVGRANAYVDWRALVPTSQFIQTLVAARLASDVMGVPTVLIARTAARNATLLTSDVDERDYRYATGERTGLGHYWIRGSLETAIERALSFAPFADMLCYETLTPDIGEAGKFAAAVRSEYPDKLMFYNCTPSSDWLKNLTADDMTAFHERLGRMGYRLQLVAKTGAQSPNSLTFHPPGASASESAAYSGLQNNEMETEQYGQASAGHHDSYNPSYFNEVSRLISRTPQLVFAGGVTGNFRNAEQAGTAAQRIANK